MTYRTPGVYVEEKSLFPASVAEVETAIPAFIGYTEMAGKIGNRLRNIPTRIKTMLEYEELFGGEYPVVVKTIEISERGKVGEIKLDRRYLYDSMRLFFDNGGGPCYVVSVGDYEATVDDDELSYGLKQLEKYDEPTIILFPDAQLLNDSEKLYTLQQKALAQCAKLKDRFALLDLAEQRENSNAPGKDFRDKIGVNDLMYGAAYTPWLYSTIPKAINFIDFYRTLSGDQVETLKNLLKNQGEVDDPIFGYIDKLNSIDLKKIVKNGENAQELIEKGKAEAEKAINKATVDFDTFIKEAKTDAQKTSAKATLDKAKDDAADLIVQAEAQAKDAIDKSKQALEIPYKIKIAQERLYSEYPIVQDIYNRIKQEMTKIPPSGAIAGVYAKVDRTRGVWKAPANVSLNSVLGPVKVLDDFDQESLNVDTTAGKSINAIRSFAGKGTMVWGARTLAGNDNEWRYIPVRRLYNMVEESIKKSTSWAVFEPNDASLWIKVKGMIDNYLTLKWREGALAGAIPEEAFFVKVGLGQTMSPQDILEGRLIVEIGMAVVRPAEFIVLQFSHKMQES